MEDGGDQEEACGGRGEVQHAVVLDAGDEPPLDLAVGPLGAPRRFVLESVVDLRRDREDVDLQRGVTGHQRRGEQDRVEERHEPVEAAEHARWDFDGLGFAHDCVRSVGRGDLDRRVRARPWF